MVDRLLVVEKLQPYSFQPSLPRVSSTKIRRTSASDLWRAGLPQTDTLNSRLLVVALFRALLNGVPYFMLLPVTFDRGPWIGFVGAMLFLGLCWDKRDLAILVVTLFLFLFLSPESVRVCAKTLVSLQNTQEDRLSDWKAALDMIADRPFSGIGLGNGYMTVYTKYRAGHIYRRAHNLYFYQAASVGIPGRGLSF